MQSQMQKKSFLGPEAAFRYEYRITKVVAIERFGIYSKVNNFQTNATVGP